MNTKHTWIALLVTAGLIACPSSVPGAGTPNTGSTPITPTPNPTTTATGSSVTRWSDPATWGGKKPVAGDVIGIPSGKTVILDESPPALKGLTIQGTLSFDRKDLELSANWIMLHGGTLEVGTPDKPFTNRGVITLTGADTGENIMDMGTKALGLMMGGKLELHGASRGLPWTRLNATVQAGSKTLVLEANPGWRSGDRIAIASTDFDPLQAEEAVIASVNGSTVTLEAPLTYLHFGEKQTFAGKTLESRAEVALLSRNVVVRGDENSSVAGFGGHVMLMDTSTARVDNVEFTRLGQKAKLRRYPIHFHMQADAGQGSYLKNSSIHHVFNRCVTIHGTNKLTLTNNAAFDTIGHCYFFEDGAETGNVLEGNLGFVTRKPKEADAVLPSDAGFPGPATFWIENPANTLRNNVAAGAQGVGFWYALPERPTGPSSPDKVAANASVYPRRTPLGVFDGNLAHSNDDTGLNVDHGPKADLTTDSAFYEPRSNPTDPKSASVTANFTNFTSYKNRDRGIWTRGFNHKVTGAILADSAIGVTFAANEAYLENSVLIGETANKGTPKSWEKKGPDGRSLPRPWDDPKGNGSSFPIRGFEFYDGKVGVRNTAFVNFSENTVRKASALSTLRFTDFDISARNFAEGLSFENALPLYLENAPEPTVNASNEGHDGYRSSVFTDVDGSVTGTPNRVVVVNNPFLVDANCTLNTTWNAHVCDNAYARFYVDNVDANPADLAPVSLTRDTLTHKMWGAPYGNPNKNFQGTLIANRAYTIGMNNSSNHLRLHFRNRAAGEWVRVSLPWTGTVFTYRDWWIDARNTLAAASSLADLEASTGNKYWLEGGTLHLKMQIQANADNRDWAVLDVCKTALCK